MVDTETYNEKNTADEQFYLNNILFIEKLIRQQLMNIIMAFWESGNESD